MIRIWIRRGAFAFAALLGLALAGCEEKAGGPAAAGGDPISIAIVPSEDTERVVASFEPIRALLEKELGRPVKTLTVTDYSSAIEAMRGKKVEIGWFGPLSYILAKREANAEPFAVGKNQGGDATYHALYLVKSDASAQKLSDLRGKSVAFVDPASTSGGLVPRYAVRKEVGEEPDKFFGKVVYAGSHDAALLALKSGSVEACAIQDITFDELSEKNVIRREDYRVLWKSEAIVQSPLCLRADLDADLKKKIRDVFLTAHEKGAKLEVDGMGKFERFVAVSDAEFRPIEAMVDQLKLERAQLAK